MRKNLAFLIIAKPPFFFPEVFTNQGHPAPSIYVKDGDAVAKESVYLLARSNAVK
jgi:hypothetical protein